MASRYFGGVKLFWCIAVSFVTLCGCTTLPASRPMKLEVLGKPGTMFVAKYTVDGLKQEEAGLMPATVHFGGRSVEWEVLRPSGDEEFRVEFYVGELRRTSTTSAGKSRIRGTMKYDANRERYGAQAVD